MRALCIRSLFGGGGGGGGGAVKWGSCLPDPMFVHLEILQVPYVTHLNITPLEGNPLEAGRKGDTRSAQTEASALRQQSPSHFLAIGNVGESVPDQGEPRAEASGDTAFDGKSSKSTLALARVKAEKYRGCLPQSSLVNGQSIHESWDTMGSKEGRVFFEGALWILV